MFRWTRLTSAKWEDSWAERLTFLGEDRVAFITWPDQRRVRIEAFVDERTGEKLVREFGGKLSKAKLWTGDPVQPRAPLNIRGRLRVFPDETSFAQWRESPGKTAGIFVPAGMAFGTGDHATTASCLRMLADTATTFGADWSALDAGTGSGILALAASAFGAKKVEAFDNDPAAVRIAKENAKLSGITNVRTVRADVTTWSPKVAHDVVLANLFSELLIGVIPQLKAATKSPGHLIFSGVLSGQLGEVTTAFRDHGFEIERTVVRGKWSAGHCRLR
ncbi:MAG: 50S ribosomal protein L11 methyltransferase [Chthoniobacterales bacterium]